MQGAVIWQVIYELFFYLARVGQLTLYDQVDTIFGYTGISDLTSSAGGSLKKSAS